MPNWGDSFVSGLRTGHEVTQGIIDIYKQSKYQQELETELEEARRRLKEEQEQARQTSNAKSDQFLEAQRQSGNQSPLAALVPGLPGGSGGNGGSALDLNSMVGDSNEKISGAGEGAITADSVKSTDTFGPAKALALAQAGTKMQDALLNSSPDGYEFEPVKVGSSRSRRSSGSPRLETNTQPVQAGNTQTALPIRRSAQTVTQSAASTNRATPKASAIRERVVPIRTGAGTRATPQGKANAPSTTAGLTAQAPQSALPVKRDRRAVPQSQAAARDAAAANAAPRNVAPARAPVGNRTTAEGQAAPVGRNTPVQPSNGAPATRPAQEAVSVPSAYTAPAEQTPGAPTRVRGGVAPAPASRGASVRASAGGSAGSSAPGLSAPANIEATAGGQDTPPSTVASPRMSPDEMEARAYRRYNEAVQNAQIKYLLRTNPVEGIKYAKQLQEQRAQWDYADMVRGALAGDTASLEKFLPYVRAATGQNVELSADGTQLMVQAADGKMVAQPITGSMIIQASRDFYPIYMLARGMAGDQFLQYVLNNQQMDIKQGALDLERDSERWDRVNDNRNYALKTRAQDREDARLNYEMYSGDESRAIERERVGLARRAQDREDARLNYDMHSGDENRAIERERVGLARRAQDREDARLNYDMHSGDENRAIEREKVGLSKRAQNREDARLNYDMYSGDANRDLRQQELEQTRKSNDRRTALEEARLNLARDRQTYDMYDSDQRRAMQQQGLNNEKDKLAFEKEKYSNLQESKRRDNAQFVTDKEPTELDGRLVFLVRRRGDGTIIGAQDSATGEILPYFESDVAQAQEAAGRGLRYFINRKTGTAEFYDPKTQTIYDSLEEYDQYNAK